LTWGIATAAAPLDAAAAAVLCADYDPGKGRGRKRTLHQNKQGYMLVMTHDDEDGTGNNSLSYCMETKELTITLSLAFFGENFQFVDGATPPTCDDASLEFDIVTRTHVNRLDPNVPTWTEARARAHFGEH
jgi:hypothetical protein